ncbi:uncharacterized protein LOC116345275 [Contarinia nasturtii]|uniref:uncharacterized protein LOC116345275 n=1 Tax=Contarinia nasturtii TaxID=265458 RepID=UPI0012D3F713|nr:uncharacterized protein LOC116345275 [Contarinia nasturtii]
MWKLNVAILFVLLCGIHCENQFTKFFKEFEYKLESNPWIGEKTNVTILIGITGHGKSTVARILINDTQLNSSEYVSGGQEYAIKDASNKISDVSETTESHTTIPEFLYDPENNLSFYDCPGFDDTRQVEYDLAISYAINRIMRAVNFVKFAFVIEQESVKPTGDRKKFPNFLEYVVSLLPNLDRFENSFMLIANKVQSTTDDDKEIEKVLKFLRDALPRLPKYKNYDSRMTSIVNALLKHNNIAIVRRPSQAGPTMHDENISNERNFIANVIKEKLEFIPAKDLKIGMSLSAEAKVAINEALETIKSQLFANVKEIGSNLETYYFDFENRTIDILTQKKYYHDELYSLGQNRHTHPEKFLSHILQLLPQKNLSDSAIVRNFKENVGDFMYLLNLANKTTEEVPVHLSSMLDTCRTNVDRLYSWYYYLNELRKSLYEYKAIDSSKAFINIKEQFSKTCEVNSTDLLRLFGHFIGEETAAKISNFTLTLVGRNNLLSILQTLFDDKHEFKYLPSNVVKITGNFIRLSDVLRQCNSDVKFVEINANSKIFLDANLNRDVNIKLVAPYFEIIGKWKWSSGDLNMTHTGDRFEGIFRLTENGKNTLNIVGGGDKNFVRGARENSNDMREIDVSTSDLDAIVKQSRQIMNETIDRALRVFRTNVENIERAIESVNDLKFFESILQMLLRDNRHAFATYTEVILYLRELFTKSQMAFSFDETNIAFSNFLKEIYHKSQDVNHIDFHDITDYVNETIVWYNFLYNNFDLLSSYNVQYSTHQINYNNVERFCGAIGLNIPNVKRNALKMNALNNWLANILNSNIEATVISQTLRITGNIVKLSALNSYMANKDIRYAEIFAITKIFIDVDIKSNGYLQQLSIVAPIWEIIGKRRINLDGSAPSSYWQGYGQPGLPGNCGGNFFAWGKTFVNDQNLEITQNGGNGGSGCNGQLVSFAQNGADAYFPNTNDLAAGVDELQNRGFAFGWRPMTGDEMDKYVREDYYGQYGWFWTEYKRSRMENFRIYTIDGKKGTAEDGHDGGAGGYGGKKGECMILGSANIKCSGADGNRGPDGIGSEGKNAMNGKSINMRTYRFRKGLFGASILSTLHPGDHIHILNEDNKRSIVLAKNGINGANRRGMIDSTSTPISNKQASYKQFLQTHQFNCKNVHCKEFKSFI